MAAFDDSMLTQLINGVVAPEDNLALQYLATLFGGGLVFGDTGAQTTLLTSIAAYTALLWLGLLSFVLGMTALVGFVEMTENHDGFVRKWTPVKRVMGIAGLVVLLTPVPGIGNGVTLYQFLFVRCLVITSNAADIYSRAVMQGLVDQAGADVTNKVKDPKDAKKIASEKRETLKYSIATLVATKMPQYHESFACVDAFIKFNQQQSIDFVKDIHATCGMPWPVLKVYLSLPQKDPTDPYKPSDFASDPSAQQKISNSGLLVGSAAKTNAAEQQRTLNRWMAYRAGYDYLKRANVYRNYDYNQAGGTFAPVAIVGSVLSSAADKENPYATAVRLTSESLLRDTFNDKDFKTKLSLSSPSTWLPTNADNAVGPGGIWTSGWLRVGSNIEAALSSAADVAKDMEYSEPPFTILLNLGRMKEKSPDLADSLTLLARKHAVLEQKMGELDTTVNDNGTVADTLALSAIDTNMMPSSFMAGNKNPNGVDIATGTVAGGVAQELGTGKYSKAGKQLRPGVWYQKVQYIAIILKSRVYALSLKLDKLSEDSKYIQIFGTSLKGLTTITSLAWSANRYLFEAIGGLRTVGLGLYGVLNADKLVSLAVMFAAFGYFVKAVMWFMVSPLSVLVISIPNSNAGHSSWREGVGICLKPLLIMIMLTVVITVKPMMCSMAWDYAIGQYWQNGFALSSFVFDILTGELGLNIILLCVFIIAMNLLVLFTFSSGINVILRALGLGGADGFGDGESDIQKLAGRFHG